MLYCGIDVHKKSSVIHILSEDGKKIKTATIESSPAAYLEFFRAYKGKAKVALEIGKAAFTLSDSFKELGIPVHIVNTA